MPKHITFGDINKLRISIKKRRTKIEKNLLKFIWKLKKIYLLLQLEIVKNMRLNQGCHTLNSNFLLITLLTTKNLLTTWENFLLQNYIVKHSLEMLHICYPQSYKIVISKVKKYIANIFSFKKLPYLGIFSYLCSVRVQNFT